MLRGRRWIAPLIAAALISAAALSTIADRASSARAATAAQRHRPLEVTGDGYVSSRACRSCHPQQYQSWHDSYHRTMTQPARPDTVFGAFDGTELSRAGRNYTLLRRGDEFWVRGDLGDAAPEQRIALVTGSHHLQIYWYETGSHRQLAALAFAWLREEQRWIPRESAFLRPPGPGRPSEIGRWNTTCITCHTTHGVPKLGPGGELDTSVAEFGIACEACHGPGQDHVLANVTPWRRYAQHWSAQRDETIANPRELGHRRASEMCGQCHGVWQFRSQRDHAHWNEHGFPYRPGDDPNATQVLFQPSLRAQEPLVGRIMQQLPGYTAGTFWSDGMERVSGREFNAMFESPCYQRGEMSCLSCHAMHQPPGEPRSAAEWADDQLALGMRGPRACTGCHDEYRGDVRAHTQHAADSPGSDCYNCHMPNTTYGLLKAMRSHQVSSPDVAASVSTGRPNACNLCHLDRTLSWTAEQLQQRYGIAPPALDDQQRSVAASVLWSLRGDAGQRALLAFGFGWEPAMQASGSDWSAPILGILMDDPYDAVRYIAGRSLRRVPGFERLDYDFVPAPETRPRAAPRVLAAFQQERSKRAGTSRPELLIDAAGRLDQARVAELLRARDMRPVHLLE
jgi:hypothetical protein